MFVEFINVLNNLIMLNDNRGKRCYFCQNVKEGGEGGEGAY